MAQDSAVLCFFSLCDGRSLWWRKHPCQWVGLLFLFYCCRGLLRVNACGGLRVCGYACVVEGALSLCSLISSIDYLGTMCGRRPSPLWIKSRGRPT